MFAKGTLTVEDLHMTYQASEGPVHAVRGVSFTVEPGEFYTLLGASGCGKTTTLRCVAGLETPDSGRITIGDQVVFGVGEHRINEPPNRRDIGMVFQSYAIWPHLNVFSNVSFPLVSGRKKMSKADARERTMKALTLVHLEDLAYRPAPLLSGGQQQRVALARALVSEPTVLLLDEPLSNLDARLRAEMRVEIKNLVKSLGVTTLYVTHDQSEALTMSDRVAVMNAGIFVEENAPRSMYLNPQSAFTATFLGDTNLFAGTVTDRSGSNGTCTVDTKIGVIVCPVADCPADEDDIWIACRPEDVTVAAQQLLGDNVFKGTINTALFTGDQITYEVNVNGQTVQAKLGPHDHFDINDQVFLKLDSDRCRPMSRTGEHMPQTADLEAASRE